MSAGLNKVVVDNDCGNDDAWAIYSLIKAEEKLKNLKVLGITSVSGNCHVDHSSVNSLMVLKTLDRLDIPVFVGSSGPLLKNDQPLEQFHGEDGLAMIYKPEEKPSKDLLQKKHAVEALRDFIEEHPNEITLICLGPLTNIALLFKMYPEVISKIKEIHIMGGNHRAVGNITRTAEFNFYFDPEAAHVVLNESTCPIKVVTWETCLESSLMIPMKWRMHALSGNNNPMCRLLDPVEEKCYKNSIYENWVCCDNFLAVTYILPEIIKKQTKFNATVELAGKHVRGLMVLDHLKIEKPNVEIIEEIDVEKYMKFMLFVCGHDVDFL